MVSLIPTRLSLPINGHSSQKQSVKINKTFQVSNRKIFEKEMSIRKLLTSYNTPFGKSFFIPKLLSKSFIIQNCQALQVYLTTLGAGLFIQR